MKRATTRGTAPTAVALVREGRADSVRSRIAGCAVAALVGWARRAKA